MIALTIGYVVPSVPPATRQDVRNPSCDVVCVSVTPAAADQPDEAIVVVCDTRRRVQLTPTRFCSVGVFSIDFVAAISVPPKI